MKAPYALTIIAVLTSAALERAHADGNPQRGAMIYGACAACHSLEPNLHLTLSLIHI